MLNVPPARCSRPAGAVISGLVLFALTFPEPGFACMIQWRPHAEVEADARVVVEAVIVAAEPPRKNFASWDYEYRIQVETVRRGRLGKKKLIIMFRDLRPHLRGEMMVCPIQHGTGIEHELEVGKRYELFLESAEQLEILLGRAMEAESEDDAGSSGGS